MTFPLSEHVRVMLTKKYFSAGLLNNIRFRLILSLLSTMLEASQIMEQNASSIVLTYLFYTRVLVN